MEQWYDKATSKHVVMINGAASKCFWITTGERQWCHHDSQTTPSKRLMPEALTYHEQNVSIGDKLIVSIRFADDFIEITREQKIRWNNLLIISIKQSRLGSIIADYGSKPMILPRITQITAVPAKLKLICKDKNTRLFSKSNGCTIWLHPPFYTVWLRAEFEKKESNVGNGIMPQTSEYLLLRSGHQNANPRCQLL